MRTIFTEKNTGFEDKSVINKMNAELSSALHDIHQLHSNNEKFDHIFEDTQQEFAMYEIMLKYKKDYYSNWNVLYVGDEPPDLVGDDQCVKLMKQSLAKKCELLLDKYSGIMDKSQEYTDELNRIYNNLRGLRMDNTQPH